MKDREKILEELGLSKNEAKIYLALLMSGLSTIGEITEKSGVYRRNVYDATERLIRKGLIGFIVKEKKKYFEATNPYQLFDILEEEKEKLKRKNKNVNLILSELLHMQKIPKEKSSIILRKGVKGIKSVLDDILKTKEENMVLGAHKPPEPIRSYLMNFHRKRTKMKLSDKIIFNRNDMERAKKLASMPFTEIRFMPRKYDSHTAINIYGNTVAILSWSEPTAIIIKDRKVANSFREYFKLLWKITKNN